MIKLNNNINTNLNNKISQYMCKNYIYPDLKKNNIIIKTGDQVAKENISKIIEQVNKINKYNISEEFLSNLLINQININLGKLPENVVNEINTIQNRDKFSQKDLKKYIYI